MRIALGRENCNFDRVLQNKWDMATGVRDCSYGRATGTGTEVLWDMGARAGIDVNIFTRCIVRMRILLHLKAIGT